MSIVALGIVTLILTLWIWHLTKVVEKQDVAIKWLERVVNYHAPTVTDGDVWHSRNCSACHYPVDVCKADCVMYREDVS